jgi:hypothetical protein
MTESALTTEYIDGACCTLDESHPGPCVWTCGDCGGTGLCSECNGDGPELCGCAYCDTSGTCPECWGHGEICGD